MFETAENLPLLHSIVEIFQLGNSKTFTLLDLRLMVKKNKVGDSKAVPNIVQCCPKVTVIIHTNPS